MSYSRAYRIQKQLNMELNSFLRNSPCFCSRSRTALAIGDTKPLLKSPRIKRPIFKSDILLQDKNGHKHSQVDFNFNSRGLTKTFIFTVCTHSLSFSGAQETLKSK